MPLVGEYEPSPWPFVRDQVAAFEASGGREANIQRETGLPVVVVTMRGTRSGKLRKAPLMRVEHDSEYALVASKGGTPENPAWYYNLLAHPDEVTIQDGPEPVDMTVREVTGAEREVWWGRAVKAFPNYAGYQAKTDRLIPVLVASPKA
jgi:deazaflavin-dependent oxidoreductase (nitroreductase family)